MSMTFEWDEKKNRENIRKHETPFYEGQRAFLDKDKVVLDDVLHSTRLEKRYFCLGKVDGRVLTVRFTTRGHVIRIFGAGYWRKGAILYEKNKT
jgi:hypothetical protein